MWKPSVNAISSRAASRFDSDAARGRAPRPGTAYSSGAAVGPAESEESLRQAVAAMDRAAKALNNDVQLSVDSSSGRAVVRVVDSKTGELIRQIPSEEALELRRALDRLAGLLIRRTA